MAVPPFVINNTTMTNFARSKKYTWMQSLQPIRDAIHFGAGGCATCPQTRFTDSTVPENVYRQVCTRADFASDMAALKTKLGVTQINVNVTGFSKTY